MLSEEFKESKITDLVYRFLLWFSFACFILWCESRINSIGDAYIAKVTTYFSYFSSSYRRRFLIGIALVLGGAAIAFKDLELFVSKNSKNSRFECLNLIVKELSSFLAKISSDLLLIAYSMLSFLVGNVVFLYCYFHDEFPVNLVMYALPACLIFMVLLGGFSIFIRSTNEDWFNSKYGGLTLSKRLAIFLLLIFCGLGFIWWAVIT